MSQTPHHYQRPAVQKNLLWKAIDEQDKGMVGYYLAVSDVNQWDGRNYSPLHAVLRNPRLHECVFLMIQLRAQLNVVDEDQRTPLMWAVHYGLNQEIDLMLKMGASIEGIDVHGKNIMDFIPEGASSIRFMIEKPWLEKQLNSSSSSIKFKRI